MDTLRFEELKHSIATGGLPNVSNETFSQAQADELKTICEQRSKNSLDFCTSLKIEKTETK